MALAITMALALAAPAAVAAPSRVPTIDVTMTDEGYAPRRFALRGGRPYVLRIANRSGKGHNLTQKAFFSLARIAPADRGLVRDGRIVVPAGGGVTVHLVAPNTRPGGTYQFSSTVLADADDDYTGVFVIR